MRELDRRAGERGERVTVKFAIDRGNIKQIVKEHVAVSPTQFEALGLPTVEQLPNTDFEVSPALTHRH